MNEIISIIICTYNRDKYIYRSLELIAENHFPTDDYEIILINNKSTDNTENECFRFRTNFPEIPFKYFVEEQQGLSYARNRGIAEATGDILVFLDDDSFVKNNYLSNLKANLTKYSDCMAFGGKILPLYESGKEPEWMCKWLFSLVSAIDLGDSVQLFSGKKFPIGANMGFRRDCIEKCGTFNVKLGRCAKNLIGGEEKDLFERIFQQKMAVYYFPDVEIEHVIPENRTTIEYIKRVGEGIGRSEKLRCKSSSLPPSLPRLRRNLSSICNVKYIKRLLLECVKWGGSLVIWLQYMLQGRRVAANTIIIFRWFVTKGLLKRQSPESI